MQITKPIILLASLAALAYTNPVEISQGTDFHTFNVSFLIL